MNDIVVLEATYNVADGFGFTDVGQELVAQTFAFRRAFYQAGDVHEFHSGWQNTLWFNDFGELIQTRIGHWHNTGVWLDRTEREVCCFDARFGERVKQGGFANVWQANDTAFKSHL
ncbi:hypothetical protein D3C71_1408720 [compost metagenome]